MTEIAIINQSTVVADDQVQQWMSALQKQIHNDFAPRWDIDASLSFAANKQAPPDFWQCVVLDDSDQADALGYHELTTNGLPIAKVFAKSDLAAGDAVSVTMSHELLEMLADPWINLIIQAGDDKIYAYENCDAVESDALGYTIDSVPVSDFVLPSYFETGVAKKYDLLGHLAGPCPTLAPGGYISTLDPATGSWSQVLASRSRETIRRANPPLGSRRWRRQVPPSLRLRSLV